MSVSYTCPNPTCGVTLKTPARVQVGKSVKCPKCTKPFVPESGEKKKEEEAGTLKLVDEPKKPETAAPAKPPIDDDEDAESIKKGYGVVAETEAEKEEAEKNKPKFTEVQDKFKKSARGPAMSLLVMPTNLLIIEGLITCIVGLGTFVIGMWPLVFNDAPPGEEELDEAIVLMMVGVFTLFWGSLICFCTAQMQELASYPWAMVGSIMGILPLLVGIFGIIMLQNPKVKAGFEEGDVVEDDEEGGDEDEEDEVDDDDDDHDEKAKKGKKKDKKPEKKLGKKLAKKLADDEDEEEDE